MDNIRAKLPTCLTDEHSPDKENLASSRKKQKDWGLGSHSGRYANHVYQVFNDPDFASQVSALREKFEALYYKDVSLTTDTTDEHLLFEDKKVIKDLADTYCISLVDFGCFADGDYAAGYGFGKDMNEFGGVLTGASDYLLNYVIGPKTSLEQIANDWPMIRELRELLAASGSVNVKSKSPESPELIYAIFKARSKGLTFTKVFRQYQDGELAGYKLNTNQYSSKDSLERYYRKYMPKPLGETIIAPQDFLQR